jgi:hypothetical protein
LDPVFEEERDLFALKCACEDCAHFDSADERCAHEWPTDPHRAQGFLDFCKEFELC